MINVLFYNKDYNLTDIFLSVSGIKILDGTYWYVVIIVFLYVLYYLLFKRFNDKIAIKMMLVITALYWTTCYLLGIGTWWYNTTFCFPLGIILATYFDTLIKYLKAHYTQILISSFLLFAIIVPVGLFNSGFISIFTKTLSSVFFATLVIILTLKIQIQSKILEALGKISYEIYLIHGLPIFFTFIFVNVNSKINIFIYFILVIFSAFIFSKFTNKVLTKYPALKQVSR